MATVPTTKYFTVYIGPGVKTASATGKLGTVDKTAQYSFGTTIPATAVQYKGGFQKLCTVNY